MEAHSQTYLGYASQASGLLPVALPLLWLVAQQVATLPLGAVRGGAGSGLRVARIRNLYARALIRPRADLNRDRWIQSPEC